MIYGCFNKLELTQCYPFNNVPRTHLHSDMFPGKRAKGLESQPPLPEMPGEDGGQSLSVCQSCMEMTNSSRVKVLPGSYQIKIVE